MRHVIPVLCLSLTLFAGCKVKELADKAAISKDLDKRGTTDLMKQIADDKYTAPADGRITDAQVQMYLKVREQEKKIAEVAKAEMKQHAEDAKKQGEKSIGGVFDAFKAMGSAADLLTADIRAAKDLGYNTQEYLWVKQQILAASTSQMAEQFGNAMSKNFDKAYDEAKKSYDEAKDEQTKKLYAAMLAQYDKSKQEASQSAEKVEPAVQYNRQLLSKYENALNAYAAELSKWSDKPEDTQKNIVDQMQKASGQQGQ